MLEHFPQRSPRVLEQFQKLMLYHNYRLQLLSVWRSVKLSSLYEELTHYHNTDLYTGPN